MVLMTIAILTYWANLSKTAFPGIAGTDEILNPPLSASKFPYLLQSKHKHKIIDELLEFSCVASVA